MIDNRPTHTAEGLPITYMSGPASCWNRDSGRPCSREPGHGGTCFFPQPPPDGGQRAEMAARANDAYAEAGDLACRRVARQQRITLYERATLAGLVGGW